MKKFPVLLWALIMAFSLVACGSSDGPENSIDQDQTPDTYGTEQPEARTVVDVWNREVEIPYEVDSIICLGSMAPLCCLFRCSRHDGGCRG